MSDTSTPPWDDEPFEQGVAAPAPRNAQRKQRAPNPYYKILVASPWQNEHSGTSGTSWTDVGVAFPLREKDGFKLRIKAGLSITGDVLLLPSDEAYSVANG